MQLEIMTPKVDLVMVIVHVLLYQEDPHILLLATITTVNLEQESHVIMMYVYYFSDPLWDGAGCSANNTCCSNTNQPWFHHQLHNMIQDDIEVRICTNEHFDNEGILVDILDLYIQ